MDLTLLLEVQALVDGELNAGDRARVEKRIASDPEARAWADQLRTIQIAVRNHEPAVVCPESREFYWSQVRRRIAAAEAVGARASGGLTWRVVLRWLTPVAGLAAVAVLVQTQRPSLPVGAEASSMVFSSDSDQVTIHWIN